MPSSQSRDAITSSLKAVRRLAVTKQRLSEDIPKRATSEQLLDVVRCLAYIQWDPISIVAPSHVLSLWTRVGDFRLSDLDRLLWNEKKLLLHWTPIASIVLSEDYSIYYSLMRRYPDSLSDSWGAQRERARKFLNENKKLRGEILSELKMNGPLAAKQFRDYARNRNAKAWTHGSKVSLMLSYLSMSGEVIVVGHKGNENIWDLADDFLPKWVERKLLSEQELELQTAIRAIRALGTASAPEINYYFVRGRYRNLGRTLKLLEKESQIHRVRVLELGEKSERYVHEADLPLLESMEMGEWSPRLSFISPFDNLICGRTRTNTIFGFDYVHEQFLPLSKRKYGTYVLPILWGERLIGRIDPQMDNQKKRLVINSVHAEAGAPEGKEIGKEISRKIEDLGAFLGTNEIEYSSRVPKAWRDYIR